MNIANLLRDARDAAGLTQAELAERAGTSQPAVNRYERGVLLPTLPTLERLVRATGRGLVIETTDDRPARLASARSATGPAAERLRRGRAVLLRAAREHGIRNIRVFGSVARGEAGNASDVDLLVELGPGRTLLDLVGFRDAAIAVLGSKVDVATPDMLKTQIRNNVLREAVPL